MNIDVSPYLTCWNLFQRVIVVGSGTFEKQKDQNLRVELDTRKKVTMLVKSLGLD